MSAPNFLTITEQVAVYLRGEIMRGRWSGTMPGMNHLAPELEVTRLSCPCFRAYILAAE
jgi:hypothetical protein